MNNHNLVMIKADKTDTITLSVYFYLTTNLTISLLKIYNHSLIHGNWYIIASKNKDCTFKMKDTVFINNFYKENSLSLTTLKTPSNVIKNNPLHHNYLETYMLKYLILLQVINLILYLQ